MLVQPASRHTDLNRTAALNARSSRRPEPHSPPGMAVQLVEDRVVAVLEHQVELPFAAEHLDQIHQVGVFQLLQPRETATSWLTASGWRIV